MTHLVEAGTEFVQHQEIHNFDHYRDANGQCQQGTKTYVELIEGTRVIACALLFGDLLGTFVAQTTSLAAVQA